MNDNEGNTKIVVTSNVIPFRRKDAHIPEDTSDNSHREMVDDLADRHSLQLFERLGADGLEFGDEDSEVLDDLLFVGEALKSAIYKLHGLYHPIQDVVDDWLEVEVMEDEDIFPDPEDEDELPPTPK